VHVSRHDYCYGRVEPVGSTGPARGLACPDSSHSKASSTKKPETRPSAGDWGRLRPFMCWMSAPVRSSTLLTAGGTSSGRRCHPVPRAEAAEYWAFVAGRSAVGDLHQPAGGGVGVSEVVARLVEFRGHGLRAHIFKFLVLSSKRPRRHVARRPGAVPMTTYPRARALGCSKGSLPRCPDVVSSGHRPLPEED
jgi:hypothetical protein